MSLLRSFLSASGVLESVICAGLVAELSGYWLHRLLHSDKLPFLSRAHMIHHLVIYGPERPMHSEEYKDATTERFSLGNVGLEWLAPSAVILAFCWGAMALIHVPFVYQIVAAGTLILSSVFTFSYLHDRMHLRDFWMARIPLVKPWFLKVRRLHDIHHRSVNDFGRMDANFGIGFHLFDRLFRTMVTHHRSFNRKGYEIALQRYALPLPESSRPIRAEGHSSLSSPH